MARTLLLGRRYNRTKKQGARTDLTSDQNDTKLQTAEVLAQQHGVSPATVKRAGQYAAAIDAIAKALPDSAPVSGRGGAAGNKEDLAAIGRIKHAQNGGDKVSKKATGVVINDKAAQADATPTQKHDTRKAMAKAAGVSTGLVCKVSRSMAVAMAPHTQPKGAKTLYWWLHSGYTD